MRPGFDLLRPAAGLALAMVVLGGCQHHDLLPLRHIDLTDAVALVAYTPDGQQQAFLRLLADGRLLPAATDGEALAWDFNGEHSGPLTDWVVVGMTSLRDHVRLESYSTSLRDTRFSPILTLVDTSDGSVTGSDGLRGRIDYPPLDASPQPRARDQDFDALGRLYGLASSALPEIGCGYLTGVVPYRRLAGAWQAGFLLTPLADTVTAWVVDASGQVAYRGLHDDGSTCRTVAGFVPATGPALRLPDEGRLGPIWLGADGHPYLTRALGDADATIELLRVDFGAGTTLTRTASWTGAPGLLTGTPLEQGATRLFFQDGAVVELGSPAGPPVAHAGLGVAWAELQVSDHAAWVTTLDAAGTPDGLLRWTVGGSRALLPTATWTVGNVVPVDDASAL